MKYILTPEEHEALDDSIKGEYTEQDGAFVLTLEGHEEALVPASKKAIAEQHRKLAETKLKEAETREADLMKQIQNLEKSGGKDMQAKLEELRSSHEKAIADLEQKYAEEAKTAKAMQHKQLISGEADKFAREHFTTPSLIAKAMAERMTVEEVEGEPVIRVLEADGKASVKSFSELQKEFLANPEFKGIVKASQGGGGGAKPKPDGSKGGVPKDLNLLKASPSELVSAIRDKVPSQ